jgi:excisionase family DNA binding protein
MKTMASEDLTTVEAARRIGVTPEEIYRLVFSGELNGGPDRDGTVRIAPDEVERFATEAPSSG